MTARKDVAVAVLPVFLLTLLVGTFFCWKPFSFIILWLITICRFHFITESKPIFSMSLSQRYWHGWLKMHL